MSSQQSKADLVKEISGTNPRKCMKCGKCSASCLAFEAMDIKPHQFVSYVLNDEIKTLMQSKSIEICLACFACLERCPRGVEPAKLLDAIRQIVVRKRGGALLDAKEIPALLDAEVPGQLLVSAFRKYRR